MSYNLIKESLEKVNSIDTWSLALIKYHHKARPNDYTCYELNFKTDTLLKSTVSDMCSAFLSIIDKDNKDIKDYTGSNSKNDVDKINIENQLIKVPWDSLIESINVADDSTELKNIKSNAFIFVGTYEKDNKEHNIYLISRRNPIYTYKKGRGKIFESRHNIIKEIDEPLLQFGKTFDALIYKGILYTINNNFETIFNMEYTHRIVCKNSLETLESLDIIHDFKSYESFALSGQHPRKFSTFDKSIIDNIQSENSLRILVDELNIPYNQETQKFNLNENKHADLFTKAICGRTKYNMFMDGVCEVPNSTPLSLS